MTDLERVTAERDRLRAALAEAEGWTAQDLKAFDDIAPNEAMLRARLKVIRTALATTPAPAPSDADRLRAAALAVVAWEDADANQGGDIDYEGWTAAVQGLRAALANTAKPDPVRDAAPELLAALETLADLAEERGLWPINVGDARAAIAKAEGRT